MPGKRPVRRPIHVGFRLTKAEAKLVKQCRQGDEAFSETARRLLLNGASPLLVVTPVSYAGSGVTDADFRWPQRTDPKL